MNSSLPRSPIGSGELQRVLLVHGQRRQLRDLAQILRSIGIELEMRESILQVPEDGQFEIVLVDYDAVTPEDRGKLLQAYSGLHGRTRLLVLSEKQVREDFVRLFERHTLTNLIARNGEIFDPEELLVTVQKLLRRDIFGIEKYFAWGVQPGKLIVSSSEQKEHVVEEAEKYAKGIGVHPRLVSLFCGVADEFCTNAVYNAPVDKDGNSRFAHYPRHQRVDLAPGEEAAVTFCCDGRRLGLSVVDPFGSLTSERLLDYLSKCFRRGSDQLDQKAGGAGLGFYQIFESVTQFIVNISPGKRTEMIGLIDVRGSYKDFATRNKSFNVFVE